MPYYSISSSYDYSKIVYWYNDILSIYKTPILIFCLRCETDHIGNYYCDCDAGWDGKDCGTMLETDCSDGIDNDKGA